MTPKQDNSTTVIDISTKTAAETVQLARRRFTEGVTRPLAFRRKQLRALRRFVTDNEDAIVDAMQQDFAKPKQETVSCEVLPLLKEIDHAINHLGEWARPERPKKTLLNFLDGIGIYRDPLGVVLVMGAWNYPINVTLVPVVGAIAAGNCVIIKPSDQSPHASQLIHDLLPNYLDLECYPVVLGGIPETTVLLEERFDYIFYTGSTTVGRIVHQAANKYLTPVTLELGGKSPVYLDSDVDMEKAAKRIIWGKSLNSGQTCIAPDYILCEEETQGRFVKAAQKVLQQFYGDDLKISADYCRIVNERQYQRLKNLMDGLKIVLGGGSDPTQKYIELSVAADVSPNHPIMQEEIFGPILPIVLVKSPEEAVTFINQREKPLALYIFSRNSTTIKTMLEKTSSGGVAVNDVILQFVAEGLPFGGVGYSGMGAYHGKATFDTFTHQKSVLARSFSSVGEKLMGIRYPPYNETKLSVFRLGVCERRGLPWGFLGYLGAFLLGIGVTIAVYFISKSW